jgi:drug/metabolite transporter (DMT)-like permease
MSTLPPPNPDPAAAEMSAQEQAAHDTRQVFVGIVLMISGVMLLPVMDAAAKILGTGMAMNPVAVACYRFVMQVVLMAPIVFILAGPRGFIPRPFHIQFLRGAFLAGATIIYFLSIRQMPLANTLAIYFVFPLIVTIISGVFMGESVGPRRYAAVLVGFIGVLWSSARARTRWNRSPF